jgi:Tfp pilus assembly protein PilF
LTIEPLTKYFILSHQLLLHFRFELAEALAFLLKRTGRDFGNNSTEHTAATQLAEELGYLPLALEQAAAYILTLETRFQIYLETYHKLRVKLLERAKPKFGNYPESVATTWLLNFKQVEQSSEASADLLRFSAFLDPDAIPFELITLGASQLGETFEQALEGIADDPFILNELLAHLGKYSLIRIEPNTQTYNIHRLVQEVLKAEMETDTRQCWQERTIKAVSHAFPSGEFNNWPLCGRLLSHVIVLAKRGVGEAYSLGEEGLLFNKAGLYSQERGQYSSAEILQSRSLTIWEQLLGQDHPNVAAILNNLAILHQYQGRYSEAEPLHKRSLSIREQQLGQDHPDVANSLNNLALLYQYQGRYSEAELLYRRSLSIREQQLGQDHPDVANSLSNLAILYQYQGRDSDVESLLLRSLSILEQQLELNYPAIASILNNLGAVYELQERYPEAEPLLVRSLSIREQQLGQDHPDVATSLDSLARLYYAQGRYSEVAPLYGQSLEIRERQFGADHPDVALSLHNLAYFNQSQGCYGGVEPLYLLSLQILCQLSEKSGFELPNFQVVLQNFYSFVAQIIQEGRQAELSEHSLTQAVLKQLQTDADAN